MSFTQNYQSLFPFAMCANGTAVEQSEYRGSIHGTFSTVCDKPLQLDMLISSLKITMR